MLKHWEENYSESEIDDLRERIKKEFSVLWEANDPAHRQEHFSAVEQWANYINGFTGAGYNPKLWLYAAWFHDLFAWDREEHHNLSGYWFQTSRHPILQGLCAEERWLLATACREHRASFKGEYSTLFSQIFACADRGAPGNVKAMLDRAIDYRLHRGYNQNQAIEGAIQHLKEKFGSSGYARYPDLYLQVFGDKLEQQRKEIDAL